MAEVPPYQTGVAYTEQDRGRSPGYWQTLIMAPVTGDTQTTTVSAYGSVDDQGRLTTIYPSAARTTTQTSATLYSRGASGVKATMVVTAKGPAPSVTLAIQTYDVASASWISLLTSAAIATSPSTTTLTISPQVATSANVSLNSYIPENIRLLVTVSNSDSLTYSIGLDWTP